MIYSVLQDDAVITEDSDDARDLYNESSFGTLFGKKVQLSIYEALYLVEKKKLSVKDGRGKEYSFDRLFRKAKRREKDFWVKYCVFRDFRNRGYVIKTALKFGAEFRVYDRGIKPGEDHAKWVVYPVHERRELTWHDFSAKNRVAHSTKKRLLIGIVDGENDIVYYEVRWVRP
ncbi:MAG: tRNA-intron lyase [Nanobdellota archaeon]